MGLGLSEAMQAAAENGISGKVFVLFIPDMHHEVQGNQEAKERWSKKGEKY